MHKSNLTQVVYNANEESDLFSTKCKENPWAKFFTPKNPRIEILRTACLVREISQCHYTFVHSSLIEYFLTRNLYKNIIKQNLITQAKVSSNTSTVGNKQITSEASVTTAAAASSRKQTTQSNQTNANTKEDYFNQRLITKETYILQFLADRVVEQETFKKSLFAKVYVSKNNASNKIAAANAITILNWARIPFSGLDLSHINIADADLSEAILHHANLSNSNLQRVSFQDAYLCNADLSNSQMDEIQLGQLPMLIHDYVVNSICYSKDGRYLAVSSGEQIILWDTNTMQVYGRLQGHTNLVKSVAFSPDGTLLASGGKDEIVRLWEVDTQQPLGKPLEGHTGFVSSVAFSPDGKLIASGSEDRTIAVWSINSQRCLYRINALDNRPSVCFTPDGYYLAFTSGNGIGLYRCQLMAQEQIALYLILYSGQVILARDGLCLEGVKGLSINNLKVLTQNCTVEEIPEISTDDGSLTATNANEVRQDKPTTPAVNYTSMSSNSPVIFKPPAEPENPKRDKKQNKNTDSQNVSDNKNKSPNRDKYNVM